MSWNKQELLTYILIYCANADMNESLDEIEHIKSKVSVDTYNNLKSEFDGDNDYESIQKIIKSINDHDLNNSDTILAEVKNLFMADGHFDKMEKNVYSALKRILQ